ncbi:MAG TPA: hypothetical protein VFF81_00565 [Noviherbaspirillum sp.]|nr:hypothetical protein [Noviherbaspirillum sp.]
MRWFAISFLIVAATWLAVVFWWQTTQRAVSTTDALLHMVVLPITILLCVILVRRTFLMMASRRGAKSDQSAQGISSAIQSGAKDSQLQAAHVAIIGAWASTSLSPNGDELLEHLNERRTRPTPDEFLADEHGFPLLSGRAKDLDTGSVESKLATAVAGVPSASDVSLSEARDALLRALALLDSLLEQMAADWPRNISGMDEPPDRHVHAMTLRGLPDNAAAPASVVLQVKLLLSGELDAAEIGSARAYVAHRLAALGISAPQMSVDTVAADEVPAALVLADEFRRKANATPGCDSPQALLLLSGVSNLCPTIVEAWESRGLTFSSQRPNGRMLGEAAFGVLCANEKTLEIMSATPMCHLSPVICAQRNAGGKDKAKDDILSGAIHKALDVAKLPCDAIGAVVCDADHRSDRTLESIAAMISQTPKLDAIHDRIAIDEACGHLGVASTLGILAAGAIHAQQSMHPVLLFNVGHSTERAAALLIPVGITKDDTSTQYLQAA